MVALVIIVLVAIFFRRVVPRGGSADSAPTDTSATVLSDKYVPEVEEGLGASVAIVLDVSGSMARKAKGDALAKDVVARSAIEAMLATTDSFVARQPGFPINVGLYAFSGQVQTLVPVQRYNRDELSNALSSMGPPKGATAIGSAMDVARADLYKAGTFRKYIVLVTDGENTDGPDPADVAREIERRSEGAVRLYLVAFDVDAKHFAFVREVHGELLGASNGDALRAGLDSIYRGKILAEAMNAGETLPISAARPRSDSTPSAQRPRKPDQ